MSEPLYSPVIEPRRKAYARFAIFALGYALFVIIWGAAVRATGSGAGCGEHWPLCNGTVVPLEPSRQTLIEIFHRLTSGLTLVWGLILVRGAFKFYPKKHEVRRWAILSLLFVLLEAAIGAGIVLLGLVADNQSWLRAVYIAAHLVNTLLLVGSMTKLLWAAVPRGQQARSVLLNRARSRKALRFAMLGVIVLSASGAIVALGDTLFPSASLAAGFMADFAENAHFLLRLRVWHPVLAVIFGLGMILVIAPLWAVGSGRVQMWAKISISLVVGQWAVGLSNLWLLVPLSLQLLHLFIAKLLWISLIWLHESLA